jgi:hypothetical protein
MWSMTDSVAICKTIIELLCNWPQQMRYDWLQCHSNDQWELFIFSLKIKIISNPYVPNDTIKYRMLNLLLNYPLYSSFSPTDDSNFSKIHSCSSETIRVCGNESISIFRNPDAEVWELFIFSLKIKIIFNLSWLRNTSVP